ncbi:MAG: O-antigen ligase family protein [Phycisphaerae bacterium]|jgi:O-antigen ligase
MPVLGQQKISPLSLLVVACIVVATAGVALLLPQASPWAFLALAGAALMFYWAMRWEITAWAWLWVLSYGMLDAPLWRLEIPGFFNMTIPRFIFLGATLAFLLYFALRGQMLRFDRPVFWLMGAMIVCCGLSAAVSGWTAPASPLPTAPYFRFLEPLLFAFIISFLFYNAVTGRPAQIKWALIPLTIYGFYALYIGYLQYAANMGASGARDFIFPSYINQREWGATYGIHFDRSRGAYTLANPQATLLIALFFIDLFLIRRLRGPYRVALAIQAVLIPPAIFFAGLRSGYLAFMVAGIIWCLTSKDRFGKGKLALAGLVLLLGAVMFRANLATEDRTTGGIAQKTPIVGRIILAERSWELFKSHPLTGVGFGHYLEAERRMEVDPGILAELGTVMAMPHNLFLLMLSETGIIGLIILVALEVLLLRESLSLYRKLPETATGLLSRPLVVVFWVVYAAWFIDGMLIDQLWDPASSALFWSFAGLIVGLNRSLEPHTTDLVIDPADGTS